jgi:hypothetical protein
MIVAFQAYHYQLMLHNDTEVIEDDLQKYVLLHHVLHLHVTLYSILIYLLNYMLNHLDYVLYQILILMDEHTTNDKNI